MHKNTSSFALTTLFTGFLLSGCASLGIGTQLADRIHITSSDRVFIRVVPFDSIVAAELTRVGLDAAKVRDNLAAELHYQFFLKKQEESPDSAGATMRVTVAIQHLQPGSGNSGSFIAGTLTGEGKTVEKAEWEVRQPAKDNVPGDVLGLHLPRMLATELLGRMKSKPKPVDNEPPPPLILLH